MEPLPSHRQLVTTLITSISDIAPSKSVGETTSSEPPPPAQPPSTSPLQAIPSSQRPLLLTLHVLFPNLLLPALDLLDRGLVTRLVRKYSAAQDEQPGGDGEPVSGDLNASSKPNDDIFIVRSLASTLTRRTRDFTLSSKRYVVHLNAWNCSCASFTFDAFPSHPAPATEQMECLNPSGDVPPCCKHLLACLLVDKWPAILGQYVEEREISREEMAGIVADL
ncbi:uncharacterized protein NECHADRAFT_93410 [Fusarium vanettenii 77-13-4]|uniref:SWIM-type domain-containing protein n=1 Tax=Fusarium vanettenii (strain ATCC MYA-4622 / CBS 123669 / FGSC 9596 / NRRL 45880 / 77-13-4) TaxID=660122 RepID=C7Z1A8_FUSV7|nr:uncharacterized protein NECHADRAFT_93410 [Fusarium vanettenii 77-13-4]EEU42332.1 hypothetical protein NECHADRAFT_93410 [Fusarium vanettenii 77-13-4]